MVTSNVGLAHRLCVLPGAATRILAFQQQGAASDSKWAAYVASMGAGNPCGWAKSQQQLSADHAAYLHTLGLDESWWRYFVAQVRLPAPGASQSPHQVHWVHSTSPAGHSSLLCLPVSILLCPVLSVLPWLLGVVILVLSLLPSTQHKKIHRS